MAFNSARKFARVFQPCLVTVSKEYLCQRRGTCLITSHYRHWYALEERFRHAPGGACVERCLPSEITSFVVDSSRSYAKCFVKGFLVVLFF